jgi:phenylpropionate dioxygenase-like ring-hydroxylating dioxygenase large terminal subunit
MFLRDYWYAAAWSEDLKDQPIAYTLLNEPVVVYRRGDGRPAALEDRCAHRRAPLSKGRVVGENLVCGYHGVAYDCKGTGVHVPGQAQVPPGLRVRGYPTVERHGCIWLWMGDQEKADESKIPDLHWADSPGWGAKGRLHMRAHYQLLNDNLCDLSHLGYVHASNVGNTALAEHGQVETQTEGNVVRTSRWTLDRPAPNTYVGAGGFKKNIDRWQISEFLPPSFFLLNFGATEAGPGRAGPTHPDRFAFQVCQWSTPETEGSTHWFWAIAHDFGQNRDLSMALPFYETMYKVVQEDFSIIEAQQRTIDRDPNAPITKIEADNGVMEARRVGVRLLNEEGRGRDSAARKLARH